MALVAYPDSASDDEGTEHDKTPVHPVQPAHPPTKPDAAATKPKPTPSDALPPLPPAFHDLYAVNARVSTSDNPDLHGGRRRAVPHIQGNWPSHVYLEWIPTQRESIALLNLIQHVKSVLELENNKRVKKLPVPQDITPSLQSDLGVPLPLHVSLSRTLQIKTEDRETFLDTLGASLRRCAVPVFNFEFQGLKWVPNFERNRWFLVLAIKRPENDELNTLLHACNQAAKSTGHPALYTGGAGDGPMEDVDHDHRPKRRKVDKNDPQTHDYSPYFHVSIAWNLTEPDAEWTALVQKIDATEYIQTPDAVFDAVKVRIGNAVHNIPLAAKRPGLGKSGRAGLGLG
ncbi:hypothetical protein COCVIDRAFT_26843 [Bipolaris victoriae FI3]|uniref:U6 snRNA phosphodiesterase n=1 Tax=Bipolaris victoriae (strain FI3) TaxID=930091 RepID=W7EEU8_BIPV3|nr:hypothetical protein COCVIDRAFT_26843 [Bipolaris victoriae FI3]